MQASRDVHVSIQDLERYLRFVGIHARPRLVGELQGCIILHVEERQSIECNIYNALMLVRSSPQLKIRWYESYLASYMITEYLQSAHEIILSPKFLECIATSATELWVNSQFEEYNYWSKLSYIRWVISQLNLGIEEGLMRRRTNFGVDHGAIQAWLQDLRSNGDQLYKIWPRLEMSHAYWTPYVETYLHSPCGFPTDWPTELPEMDFSDFMLSNSLARGPSNSSKAREN